MNVLGMLRSTYFYAALTIAGGAIVIAAVALVALGLQLAGFASTPPMPESVRELISGTVAVFIFAMPIGAIHLWLVQRSLSDPDERTSGPRHLFLNGWIVAGLLTTVGSLSNLAEIAIVQQTKDVSFPIAGAFAGIVVTLVGRRWRDAYPDARRDAQLIGAFATLGLATAFIVVQLLPLVDALLRAMTNEPMYYFRAGVMPRDVISSSLLSLAAAYGMWGIGLRWLWPWRDVAFRTIYAAVGFGIGVALVAVPGSDALARVIGIARGGVQLTDLRGVLEAPAVGVVLVAMHLPWLRSDRGRISYPARVTDRIVRGITALGGLGALTLAATAWGSVIVQDWLRIGPPQNDPLRVRDQAAATLLVALALYPLPWWGFLRATAGDPRSGLRRAYILFVTCASLLGAIVAGVISASNAIQMVLGAMLSASDIRDTIDAAGWLLIFGVVLGTHLWLLVRDMRAARALAPIATVRPMAIDPLDALLEEVAAGRISAHEAATTIRAWTAPPHVTGKTA